MKEEKKTFGHGGRSEEGSILHLPYSAESALRAPTSLRRNYVTPEPSTSVSAGPDSANIVKLQTSVPCRDLHH